MKNEDTEETAAIEQDNREHFYGARCHVCWDTFPEEDVKNGKCAWCRGEEKANELN